MAIKSSAYRKRHTETLITLKIKSIKILHLTNQATMDDY